MDRLSTRKNTLIAQILLVLIKTLNNPPPHINWRLAGLNLTKLPNAVKVKTGIQKSSVVTSLSMKSFCYSDSILNLNISIGFKLYWCPGFRPQTPDFPQSFVWWRGGGGVRSPLCKPHNGYRIIASPPHTSLCMRRFHVHITVRSVV